MNTKQNSSSLVQIETKKKLPHGVLVLGDAEILPSTAARNIGAYMDSELNMNTHINSVIKSCYFQLKHLAKIRKYLTIYATQKLIHAFIYLD